MSSKKLKNRLAQGLFSVSLIFALVMIQFLPFVPLPKIAAEDFTGNYNDRVTITVEGIGNFVDADPFDDNMNYKLTVAEDCNSEIKGFDNDANSETETVDIYLKKTNSVGECVDDKEGKVTLSGTDKRWVTAYKIDEKTIFMPAHKTVKNEFGAGPENALNGYYKMTPSDYTGHNPDHYIYYVDGGWIAYDSGASGRIRFSEKKYQVQKCLRTGCDDFDDYNIVFANNGEITQPDANIYPDVSGNAENEPTEEEEAQASCESENNPVFSWILCPVLNFVDETILGTGGESAGEKGLMGIVDDLLSVDASLYDNDGLKLAWSYFRNIAMAILVLVGLIMIVGTAISKE